MARFECFLLHPDVDLGVAVRRVQADVTEPAPDDIDVNTRFEKMNRRCVPKYVGRDGALVLAGWDVGGVAPDEFIQTEAGQRSADAAQKHLA